MTSLAIENTLEEDRVNEAETSACCAACRAPWPLRVLAELFGTFLVCFAIYAICTFGSIIFSLNLAYVAIGTGLAYAAGAFLFAKVSGGHLNPAVSLAAMLTGKTKILDGVLYIIAQTLGATLAAVLIKFLLPVSSNVPLKQWLTTVVNGFDKGAVAYSTINQYGLNFSVTQAIAVEVVACIIIVAMAMRAYGTKCYVPAVGAAYALGAAVAFPVTAASLNPARSTGIALLAWNASLDQNPLQQLWLFWVCPVLAAALVALVMLLPQMIASFGKGGKKKAVSTDTPVDDTDDDAEDIDELDEVEDDVEDVEDVEDDINDDVDEADNAAEADEAVADVTTAASDNTVTSSTDAPSMVADPLSIPSLKTTSDNEVNTQVSDK